MRSISPGIVRRFFVISFIRSYTFHEGIWEQAVLAGSMELHLIFVCLDSVLSHSLEDIKAFALSILYTSLYFTVNGRICLIFVYPCYSLFMLEIVSSFQQETSCARSCPAGR